MTHDRQRQVKSLRTVSEARSERISRRATQWAAARILWGLRKRGWSQRDLAQKLGRSQGWVSNAVHGRRQVGYADLCVTLDALGEPTDVTAVSKAGRDVRDFGATEQLRDLLSQLGFDLVDWPELRSRARDQEGWS